MCEHSGIDPLRKTTELQQEVRRRKEAQKQREMEDYQKSKRTEVQLRLLEQADKLKLVSRDHSETVVRLLLEPSYTIV